MYVLLVVKNKSSDKGSVLSVNWVRIKHFLMLRSSWSDDKSRGLSPGRLCVVSPSASSDIRIDFSWDLEHARRGKGDVRDR